MNESTQQILIVEIKTVERASFNTEQLQKMVVYRDSNNNYFLSTRMGMIQKAILEAISCLGNNYRHPLLFNVQVLPGDEIDAYLASIKDSQGGLRRRRKRR